MLHLAWPWLAAAVPLPLLVAFFVRPARARTRTALRVPFFIQFARIETTAQRRRDRTRLYIAVLAWLCLVGAACRPQLIGEPVGLPLTGRDLMLAVDISGSMKTRDLKWQGETLTTRMSVIKRLAGDFIERRAGDRIGLILFGTRAYLQVPLTFDRKIARSLLDEAVVGLAGERTAIGDAIALGIKHLHERPASARVLLLLTDGSNTAGVVEPRRAGELAAVDGLRIHIIGVGADGAISGTAGRQSRDATSAQSAYSELDETVLRDIAAQTGGRYFRARDALSLARIYSLIDELEPASKADEVLRQIDELYPWPLASALLLLGLTITTDALRFLTPNLRPGRARAGGA